MMVTGKSTDEYFDYELKNNNPHNNKENSSEIEVLKYCGGTNTTLKIGTNIPG